MVILIDTDVILDHLAARQPFVDFSASPIQAILPEDFLQKIKESL